MVLATISTTISLNLEPPAPINTMHSGLYSILFYFTLFDPGVTKAPPPQAAKSHYQYHSAYHRDCFGDEFARVNVHILQTDLFSDQKIHFLMECHL